MPELLLLIGLLVVGVLAMGLALTPPKRAGAFGPLLRFGAGILLIGLGVFLETRGLALPAIALAGVGGYLVWRQRSKAQADAGHQGDGSSVAMSRKEAYAVLGLSDGAGEEQIRRTHHELMQKIHPDHGGSDYLATKLNQARDVLLGGARPR